MLSNNMLQAQKIKKSFNAVQALKDANFELNAGEVCGLVGANGSGKTTFARILSGLIKPDDGYISFYNDPVNFKTGFDPEEYRLTMVHQNLSLIPEMTVWQNITLGREKKKNVLFLDKKKCYETAKDVLNDFGANIKLEEKIINLPPDQKQVVEIAKALSKDPKILILDEPTASLDFDQVKNLFAIIEKLKKKGVGLIFISHRIWEILKICDRLVAFRNGNTAGIVDFASQKRDERLIIPLITDDSKNNIPEVGKKEKIEVRPENSLTSKNNILVAKKIEVPPKLHEISFTLKRGEVLGIGGLQGQGQEELLNVLSGVLCKSEGEVIFEGKEINIRSPKRAIKQGIFMIPGDRITKGLFLSHTVKQNLIYPKISMRKYGSFISKKMVNEEVNDIIDKISLIPKNGNTILAHLSGGNQQKIVIGKWLMLSPKILLLNDPTKGVDIGTRNSLYSLILELTKGGTSVILYASDNEELIRYCDRVLIMFEGRITEELVGDDICEEKIVTSSLLQSKNKQQ